MKFNNPEEFFIKINQAYHLFLAGPLIFFVVLFFEKGDGDWKVRIDEQYLSVFSAITPAMGILLVIYAIIITKKNNQNIDSSLKLKDKLIRFNTHFRTEQFLFFLSGTTSIAGLYFTGSTLCIMSYLAVLFIASIQRPSTDRLKKSLNLNKTQYDILRKKLAFEEEL